MSAGVYAITNLLTGEQYIGSTNNLIRRWKEHRSTLSRGVSRAPLLQRAWGIYGSESFEFVPLLICAAEKNMLRDYEQRCLDGLSPAYNICQDAWSPMGVKHSPEFCAAVSARLEGNTNHLGIPHSNATRARMSEIRRGKKQPPRTAEHRINIGKALKGVLRGPQSLEHIAKRVASRLATLAARGAN